MWNYPHSPTREEDSLIVPFPGPNTRVEKESFNQYVAGSPMEWTRETTNSERVNNRTLLFILFNSSSVLSECSTKESALSAGVPSVLNNKFSFAGFYLMNGIRNGSLMAYEMEIGTASEMVQTRLLNKLAIR